MQLKNRITMKWITELPELDGRYIVKTESTLLHTEYVLYATIQTNEKGQKTWSFRNQTFVAYLSEESI